MRPLLVALAVLTAPAVSAQSAPFTLADVFELEWAEDPQISPDGDRVVYVRAGMDRIEDRRRRSLWVVGTDGGGHRKLTSSEQNESSARWSPDGDRVAYVAATDEGAELYVRWMDTGETARLTQLDRSPSGLAWSPDGSTLAFSMLVPEKDPAFDVAMPSPPEGAEWAPKPRIVDRVAHESDGSGNIEPGFRHVFVVPADGGTPRQLTRGDVMAGVDAVIATGDVHPDSLFVTGGSAGGTMTAWIVGNTDRFRAAAVVKPVVNWISKTLVADNHYAYANYRYPGQPWENPMAYWEKSPISVVANVETPTLVMVGTEDLRTPPSEARQLYHALRLRDVETAYVEVPGAAHFIANRPSQLAAKVAYILAWFDRYRGARED